MWLDGEDLPSGLVVDTDLRWLFVKVLAAAGVADEADIAAEVERDDTITGRENAAYARAARPTTEAKEDAWETIINRLDTPNEVVYFQHGGILQRVLRDLR